MTPAPPLTRLPKKKVLLHWNASYDGSFHASKYEFANARFLAFPDYREPFIIKCNEAGKKFVITYASDVVNSAEAIYSDTHFEAKFEFLINNERQRL